MAMDALRVQADECVVVEDSMVGIAAGLAAGAAVLGVPTAQVIAPAPALTVTDGLTGIGPVELADVLADADLADSAA
jgi:beta-phosphoglucomutase-like phosphatase (HAD superfamily)